MAPETSSRSDERRGHPARQHAVVIGGGIAGLVSAHVLSAHFTRVTLVERDLISDGAAQRRGVPQAAHQHVLLARGRRELEVLFPGLDEEIASAGAEPMDVADELAWLTPAGWTPRFRSGIIIRPCSRQLLEWRIRERVRGNADVEIRDGHEVLDLLTGASRVVVGARVRPSGRREVPASEIRADLVVDASGRGSRAARWLEDLGLTVPPESAVDAHIVYTSRFVRGPPALPEGRRGAYIQSAPPTFTRGGAMLPIEDGCTLVTLIGRGGDAPPADDAGFLAYARTLRSPLIHDAIAGLEPLSPIATSRATSNRRHHYERVRSWPDGLVVLGDAVCAFNPVYGQGMTTAILGAALLGRLLAQRRDPSIGGLGARYQRRLARLIAAPWTLDTDLDLRVRGATGPPPDRRRRARQAYLARLARLGTERRDVRLAWLQVFHMLRGPRSLMRPEILVRVALRAAHERAAVRLVGPSGKGGVVNEQLPERGSSPGEQTTEDGCVRASGRAPQQRTPEAPPAARAMED